MRIPPRDPPLHPAVIRIALSISAVVVLAACVDKAFAGAGAWQPKGGAVATAAKSKWRIQAPPPNDQCAGAIVLGCGTFFLNGNTDEATNDYTFLVDSLSCTASIEDGRDVVYRIDAVAGDSLWVDYTSKADAAIYLVTNCNNVQGSCVAGEDSLGVDMTETLRYKFTSPGIYYLILDSYGLNTSGLWHANGQVICLNTPAPPSNDVCGAPIPISCGPINITGSTEFAFNDYEFPSTAQSCIGKRAQGKDVVFSVSAIPGDSLKIDYTSTGNGSIYIIYDCDSVTTTCIGGVDAAPAGGTEVLRFRFFSVGTYYIILDSEGLNTFGLWSVTGSFKCAQTPANDQCDQATAVPCGNFAFSGTTQFASPDYSSVGCPGIGGAGGRDVVYRINAVTGDSLNVRYTSSSDGVVYLATNCAAISTTCVAAADANIEGETETLAYKFTGPGVYYLFFDSYVYDSYGTWSATGNLVCPPTAVGPGGPATLALGAIHPNPFLRTTAIEYSVPSQSPVTLRIYDLQGRVVRTLVDQEVEAGDHHATWDGRDDQGVSVHGGVYFARLSSLGVATIRRTVVVR